MKKYQSELDNLDNNTIKAIEYYTRETVTDDKFYSYLKEYEDIRDETLKIDFLEELADELNLLQFNLTDIQEIIMAYMFVNDLFSKAYTDGIMELLDVVL